MTTAPLTAPVGPQYFLSALHGDDTRDGTSPAAAVKTKPRFDQILMPRRGTPFVARVLDLAGGFGSLDWLCGQDAARRAILDFSACDRIQCPGSFIDASCSAARPGNFVTIRGARVKGAWVGEGISLYGPWHDVEILNCDTIGFAGNMAFQGAEADRMTGLRVAGNVIADAYYASTTAHAEGLLIGHCDGITVEDNVLDHNGWIEGQPLLEPTFRHNLYLNPDNCTRSKVLRNFIARGANNGARSSGWECYDNTLVDNACQIAGAPGTKYIGRNVCFDSHDISPTDPFGYGIEVRGSGTTVEYNVLSGRSRPSTANMHGILVSGTADGTIVRGNAIDGWGYAGDRGASGISYVGSGVGRLFVYNNKVRMRGARLCWGENVTCKPSFGGNQWAPDAAAQPFMDPGRNPSAMDWTRRQQVMGVEAANESYLPWGGVPPLQDAMAACGFQTGAMTAGEAVAALCAAARARDPRVGQINPWVRAAVGVGE